MMKYIETDGKKYRIGGKNYIRYREEIPESAEKVLFTTLKTKSDDKSNSIDINGVHYELLQESDKYRIIGYISTDEENVFVGIISQKRFVPMKFIIFFHSGIFIPMLLIMMATAAIAAGSIVYNQATAKHGSAIIGVQSTEKEPTSNDPVVPYSSETEEPDITNQKYTIIDGIAYDGEYMDVYPSDTIPLGNNEENEGIYLQFVIKDESGNEIYVSPKLNPGEKIDWSPCEYLANGIQKVTVSVNVYHQDTNIQDIGADMDVTFNINK